MGEGEGTAIFLCCPQKGCLFKYELKEKECSLFYSLFEYTFDSPELNLL
jgi:hypothetical protein